jgi:hypothetical protein
MTFYDIHELNNINASGKPFLLNDLSYLKDHNFLPVDKLKSIGNCKCHDQSNICWISKDSTTLDSQRSTRFCLDSVPANSKVDDYWAIYDKNSISNRYKSLYYSYEDLPGQRQYYVDPGMSSPFFPPLFPKNTKALGAIYIDPMNNIQHDFRRSIGVCGPKQPLDCNDCDIPEFRDSQEHREDMLSNIMRVRNRREYEPVYFNFTTRYQQ